MKTNAVLRLTVLSIIFCVWTISSGCSSTLVEESSTLSEEPVEQLPVVSTKSAQQDLSGGRSERANSSGDELEIALADLGGQIGSSISGEGKTTVAVIEFSDLDGHVTQFGKYLSEELITRLFQTGNFKVIERQLLNKIIDEQKLSFAGLVDTESAKKLGMILGVDAIVSGTITDLVDDVKVNARLISAETGELFAVASVGIRKSRIVRELLGRSYSETYAKQSPASVETSADEAGSNSVPEGYFFYEDFSSVPKGTVPEDWRGGEFIGVMSGKDGVRELRNFEVKEDLYVETPQIPFPENYELEIKFWWDFGQMRIHFGSMSIWFRDTGAFGISNTTYDLGRRLENKEMNLKIVANGNVYAFYIDHQEIHVGRYDDVNLKSVGFSNRNIGWPTRHFGVRSIKGKFIE